MRVPVCVLRNRPVRFNRLACVALLINQTDLFTILLLFSSECRHASHTEGGGIS